MRFNSTIVRLEEKQIKYEIRSSVCFNSTIVRLEAFNGLLFKEKETGFNSTIVRLEECIVYTPEHLCKLFQFYNSSIRSEHSQYS